MQPRKQSYIAASIATQPMVCIRATAIFHIYKLLSEGSSSIHYEQNSRLYALLYLRLTVFKQEIVANRNANMSGEMAY